MSEGQVAAAIEYEVATHLRDVELFRMPDPSPQDEANVAPYCARRRDCGETPAPETQSPIAQPPGVSEPQKRMSGAFGEALQVVRTGKGDHRYPPLRLGDLLVELPQLREMFLAVESTEVAKQNQNRRSAKQPMCRKDFAIEREEVEVEIDPHRIMMRSSRHRCVIHITDGHRHYGQELGAL